MAPALQRSARSLGRGGAARDPRERPVQDHVRRLRGARLPDAPLEAARRGAPGRLLPLARPRGRARGARGAEPRARTGRARRRRRDRGRAGPLPARLRRLPPRGPRAGDRERARGADGLPVRPRALVAHAIETILLEERRYPPPREFAAQANAQPEIYERDFDE